MGILSTSFLLLVCFLAVGSRLLPPGGARVGLLTIANVVFVGSFATRPVSLVPLAAFLAQGWLAVIWLRRRPGRGRLALAIGWVLAVFVVLKQYPFVARVLPPLPVFVDVGLSYVLFRVLHLMIDAGTGEKLDGLTPLRFFNYCCLFLTFVSGPLQRFEGYVRQEERCGSSLLDGELLRQAGARATTGLLKLVLAAPIAFHVHGLGAGALQGAGSMLGRAPPTVQLAIALIAYLMFLYWNFSGYMDVVIAAGMLLGFTLPENFAQPFRTPNFIDLWSRWHITLSDWFRFYLFNPTVTWLTRWRTDPRLLPYYGVVGFFVTFFVMGLWHGTTGVFVLYGLMLGTGASLNKLYQVKMRDWLGKPGYRRLCGNRAYARLCNGLAMAFLALALACFWLDWAGVRHLFGVVGLAGIAGAFACTVAAVMAAVAALDVVQWLTMKLRIEPALASPWSQQLSLSLKVFVILVSVALGQSDAPAFVYAGF
jgi:D-alanyl-lipoteichoic acid acyltransferase DltB (MBOAT superfamily)